MARLIQRTLSQQKSRRDKAAALSERDLTLPFAHRRCPNGLPPEYKASRLMGLSLEA
jgi:hypothetical protein